MAGLTIMGSVSSWKNNERTPIAMKVFDNPLAVIHGPNASQCYCNIKAGRSAAYWL